MNKKTCFETSGRERARELAKKARIRKFKQYLELHANVKTACFFTILAFLLFNASLVSASHSETDYPQYVVDEGQWIEILVLDSETREPIWNASITGTIGSEPIPASLRTDYRGLALMSLNIGDSGHEFDFLAGATAYDPRAVSGRITSTDNRKIVIELDYNPFDLELSENSGGLTRGYSSYSYSGRYSVPFTAQRTVPVLDSKGNQIYDTVTSRKFVGYTWEQKVTKTEEKYVSGYKYTYTEYHRKWDWSDGAVGIITRAGMKLSVRTRDRASQRAEAGTKAGKKCTVFRKKSIRPER